MYIYVTMSKLEIKQRYYVLGNIVISEAVNNEELG